MKRSEAKRRLLGMLDIVYQIALEQKYLSWVYQRGPNGPLIARKLTFNEGGKFSEGCLSSFIALLKDNLDYALDSYIKVYGNPRAEDLIVILYVLINAVYEWI